MRETVHKDLTDEAIQLRARLEEIEGEPVRAVSEYCAAFRAWEEAIKQKVEREPGHWETPYLDALWTLHLPILKSNLLARLIYEGHEVRPEPCPEHGGPLVWMRLGRPPVRLRGRQKRNRLGQLRGAGEGVRRWKIWRIDRGENAAPWQGAEGPATNPPPEDSGLTGMGWVDAATVEVVELPPSGSDEVATVADVLHRGIALEDEETGQPAPREHYIEVARAVVAALSSDRAA